jgi:hypothetical protein
MNHHKTSENNPVAKSFLTAMSSADFWAIVHKCKKFTCLTIGAANNLAKLQPQQVAAFKWHLENFVCDAAYSSDLEHAVHMLYGDDSDDDTFDNFLYGLVSQGKEVYETAVLKPDSLIELLGQSDISNEGFRYAPGQVYEKMTGQELPSDCWN